MRAAISGGGFTVDSGTPLDAFELPLARVDRDLAVLHLAVGQGEAQAQWPGLVATGAQREVATRADPQRRGHAVGADQLQAAAWGDPRPQ
jgi:hypothetical protein